ncbi:phosphatidylinositol-3-phosphatase ymr1 [Coemansia brasiliensis]|uniref:Phosphatidylinositol-3-phosphatase ymr1 n=1 Tax=Coemansia brasiliensis TaxID=2650707 RepID=A0A9W8IEU5_9FUNG|nr:phosphatidylinositol-3-phosphatase ymr1 [Coemansia brasiliensis]
MIHSAILIRPPRLVSRDDYDSDYEQQQMEPQAPSAEELAAWALQGAIKIRCHHFVFVTLRSDSVRKLYGVFATIKYLSCVSSLKSLYAFKYYADFGGKDIPAKNFDLKAEFQRMGVGKAEGVGRYWRFSESNHKFQLCTTYPPLLVVPSKISDTTLTYAARYRSKARLPVLCYLHPNGSSMTRSSQPMVGLKQARSVQDEKLVEAILATSEPTGTPPRFQYERSNIIIDARPTTNAVVNRAVGAGSENMDHYKRCRKVYLGIDNIHVMREALNKLVDAIQSSDGKGDEAAGVVSRIQNSKSNWLRHIANILEGAKAIVEAIDGGHHVLVHCSDGWDRTAQLTSLAQLCLDPYYRTISGFATLVEKEWVSFGHQFTLRGGYLGHPDRFKVTRAASAKASSKSHSSRRDELAGDSASIASSSNDNATDDNVASEAASDFDTLLQTGTSMFGRFATRAFRGVQSRISSAIQAASDNMDDMDDTDPFISEYPELQPNYVLPPAVDSADVADGSSINKRSNGFRLGRPKHDHETSPVFQQFLDCVFQLWVQHPTMFEFNERFLLDLFYHLHSTQFGTFLCNNMKERSAVDLTNTTSVWAWMEQRDEDIYLNELYQGDENKRNQRIIAPNPQFVQYWSAMFSGYDPAFASQKVTEQNSSGELVSRVVQGLNYTGETALLDAAPANPNRRHATMVTFAELGVFDFRGDGRARVALELGAFSSEKDSASKADALIGATPMGPGAMPLRRRELVTALGTNETRPVRDTDPIELDHVYLVFAKSRAVNNFVAQLYSSRQGSDDEAAMMMCSDIGSWIKSEFVAPISALKRPTAALKVDKEVSEDKEESDLGSSAEATTTVDERPKISFISATGPTGAPELLPRPTRVTGMQKRDASSVAESEPTGNAMNDTAGAETNSTDSELDKPLLSNSTKANDVFLVEYEWEWLVPRGGEYAVVIANCAATTIQFKYNLIMANRWHDGQWTNLPAGWMPVQRVFPAVCFTLWGVAAAAWALWLVYAMRNRCSRPLVGAMLGAVPVLRFVSCVADQSRYRLWGSGSYEATMIVVSTSLVDALADGAQLGLVLALAKGWGVVRARLAGSEKRLVPGLVGFVCVATLYDGATRGGGVLAVGVLQGVAVAYAWASVAHTRRVHAVQLLRLVSRNEPALLAWWASHRPAGTPSSASEPPAAAASALALLSRRKWSRIQQETSKNVRQQGALSLVWSAARKERLLTYVFYFVVPLQLIDILILIVSSFAIPPHSAFVGLLLAQATHWIAFITLFATVVSGGLELPEIPLPPLPAITTRRSIPLPPPNAAHMSPRPMPPLGRLRLLHSSTPFAAATTTNANDNVAATSQAN